MPNRLAEYGGQDALRRSLNELECKGATDAVTHEEELLNAKVVHQPQLVVGERPPRIVNLDRPGRLSAIRVALVHRDASEIVLEHLHGVEHLSGPFVDSGVQASAGGHQKRETGPNFLIVDADIAFGIKRHCSFSLIGLCFGVSGNCNLADRAVKAEDRNQTWGSRLR